MIDVRFPTTLQMMLSLALAQSTGGLLLNSRELADGAGTNPTLVRRLLPLLSKAQLITVAKGRDGGVTLSRPAEEITLGDIYRATMANEPLWNARDTVPHRCLVSNNINAFFTELTRQAEDALFRSLSARTLAGSLDELRAAENAALA